MILTLKVSPKSVPSVRRIAQLLKLKEIKNTARKGKVSHSNTLFVLMDFEIKDNKNISKMCLTIRENDIEVYL